MRCGGNVSLRELECPGLGAQTAPEGGAQPALGHTITVTRSLPVIGPLRSLLMLTFGSALPIAAQLHKFWSWSRDTQLLIVSVSDLSVVFPAIDLQLGEAHVSRQGRRGRAGGHLAPHRRGPGGGAGGLPARAEGDVAGVGDEGAGPGGGEERERSSAGGEVQAGRLSSAGGRPVDLVRDVTLIVNIV